LMAFLKEDGWRVAREMDEEGVVVIMVSVDTKERSGDALLAFWGGV
jgi:hypothetical protein